MKILITENQLKLILEQGAENASYRTTQDNFFTTEDGEQIKIPKGTKFTAHFWNGENLATVDRYDAYGEYTGDSTRFYCDGGKFYNSVSKKSGYEKSKTLSNVLWKQVCNKALKDKENLQKKENTKYSGSLYKDVSGKPVAYYKSVDFTRNKQTLSEYGLNVNLEMSTPENATHHFNLVAIYNLREIARKHQSILGGGYGCMAYGLTSIGNTKSVSIKGRTGYATCSNKLDSYSSGNGAKLVGCGNTSFGDTKKGYAFVFLMDFYFSFDKILADVNGYKDISLQTPMFPNGAVEFFRSLYQGDSYNTVVNEILKVPQVGCITKTKTNPHDILAGIGLIAGFVPMVGPILALGIGSLDAAIYYYEGNTKAAGISLLVSLIPIVSKIPAVKAIANTTLEGIAQKAVTNGLLTSEERAALSLIEKNKDVIAKEVSTYSNSVKSKAAEAIKTQAKGFGKELFKTKTPTEMIKEFGENNMRDLIAKKFGIKTKGKQYIKDLAVTTIDS